MIYMQPIQPSWQQSQESVWFKVQQLLYKCMFPDIPHLIHRISPGIAQKVMKYGILMKGWPFRMVTGY